jgi:PHD/YefM family antitoxin component YafN of YafNO toxin-antitoxin module
MMIVVTTIPANDVRIPSAAREALARHEPVMVLSHGRPAYVIVSPDAYDARRQPLAAPVSRGRRLRDALEILETAPRPDPQFGDDLEAVRASPGSVPTDPWERS